MKVPFPFRRQIVYAIFKLKTDPRPSNADDLGGATTMRLVTYGWHVVYDVDDDLEVVTIRAIRHS